MSQTSVDAVNERFRGVPSVAEARCISSFPSDLPGDSFSLVAATEVIEHLDDTELDSMLGECRRLLAPGGYIVLTTPNEEDYDAAKVCCPECGCVFHR